MTGPFPSPSQSPSSGPAPSPDQSLKAPGNQAATGLPQARELVPGDIVAERYKVISVIGKGGFGSVYKVFQTSLKREFALKTLNAASVSQTLILRLKKEAQAAGRLEHPNLVRAVDFGTIDGKLPYLVMDYVDGPTLAQYLQQRGRLEVKEALKIFIPIAMALAYAHKEGIIHRDLKPSNIILSPDESGASLFVPKIVDFGIAKTQFGDESHALTLTAAGDVFGTPLYMSPEQCAGTGVDHRSDIYAVGCLLFETLTGAPPFRGATPLETMMQHGLAPLPSLKEASLGLEFPRALESVLSKMLAKEPNKRYQNFRRVADDLIAVEHGDYDRISAFESEPDTPVKKTGKMIAGPLIGLVFGGIVGGIIGFGSTALQNPATSKVTDKPLSTSAVLDSPGFLDLAPTPEESEYFFSKKYGKIVFKVPPGKHSSFGKFYWWQSGRLSELPAAGGTTIPQSTKLIFAADANILDHPYFWGYFHPDELYGVILRPHSCYLADLINSTIRAMPQQDNLRILSMTDKTMSKKALESIGQISQLRWLDMHWVTMGEDNFVKGATIADFPNLKNIRVLNIDSLDTATPVLKQLVKSSRVLRLGLKCDFGISAEDAELFERLQETETLSVRGRLEVSRDKLLDALAGMKNLRHLELDYDESDCHQPRFKKFKHLSTLTLENVPKDPDEVEKIVSTELPEGCRVEINKVAKFRSSSLFDPLKQDPERFDIWK